MPWVRLDDHFDEHPKLAAAGPLGLALFVTSLAYCNRNLTDGFIPRVVALRLCVWEMEIEEEDGRLVPYALAYSRGHEEDEGGIVVGSLVGGYMVVNQLTRLGLWDLAPGGYRIHDYADFQPSRSAIEAERSAAKDRMRRVRRNGGGSSGEVQANTEGTEDVRPVFARSSVNPDPDPDPDPDPKNESSRFDLTKPEDVMAYHFRGPTDRQRDTFLASWIDTEGAPEVVRLINECAKTRDAGDKGARDPYRWIESIVAQRRTERVGRAEKEQAAHRGRMAEGRRAARAFADGVARHLWADPDGILWASEAAYRKEKGLDD